VFRGSDLGCIGASSFPYNSGWIVCAVDGPLRYRRSDYVPFPSAVVYRGPEVHPVIALIAEPLAGKQSAKPYPIHLRGSLRPTSLSLVPPERNPLPLEEGTLRHQAARTLQTKGDKPQGILQ
jgi:hypothetical protein